MLISYKFNNYCSFAKEAEFDLLALDDNIKYQFPDHYINTKAGYDLLKTAVIIGENAGGKTNFINSLSFFQSLFENTRPKRAFRSLIHAEHLHSSCPAQCNTKQEFDIHVLAKSCFVYHYNLQIDEFSIIEETFSYKNSENEPEIPIISVKRENMYHLNDAQNAAVFETNIQNCKEDIKKMFSQSVFTKGDIGLFISKLAILGETHALEFVNWINNTLVIESKNSSYAYKNLQNTEDHLKIIKDPRFLDILRMVDYSIINIEIDDEKPFTNTKIIRRLKDGRVFSRELNMDSGGVEEFFSWAVALFRVVYEDKIIFADEMDRVINPVLAERMISFIHGNRHQGQFIFSTHNALHLDLIRFMKEQIYFISKNMEDLNSELFSLADFPEIEYETTKIYELYMKGILGGTAFE